MSGLSRNLLAVCVLLGSITICSAQDKLKNDSKPDAKSRMKSPPDQAVPNLANMQSGIVYGDDYAYLISAPKGWIMDYENADEVGASSLFYRKGESWEKGIAVMYVRVEKLEKGMTAKTVIADDLTTFKKHNSKMKITQGATLRTLDGRTVVTYVFQGVNEGIACERVAYVEMPTVVLLIALSSKTSVGYKNALSDHAALVKSVSHFVVIDKQRKKAKAETIPLSIKCSIEGLFSKGSSWNLDVEPDGAAKLFVQSYPKPKQRHFNVTAAQLAELARAVDAEHYFELKSRYGDIVPDSSSRTLTIRRGDLSKTVTLHYLRAEDPDLPQIKRSLRVWNLIRKWFSDPEAVDLRQYDQRLLDAPSQSGAAT